jgi:hypothetical protein
MPLSANGPYILQMSLSVGPAICPSSLLSSLDAHGRELHAISRPMTPPPITKAFSADPFIQHLAFVRTKPLSGPL